MKRALISDIHSNHEALTAVLADIHQQGIERIYCLGDIVGYGPNPRECLQEMKSVAICILGNHDEAVFAGADPDGFGSSALRAVEWTREQLREEDHAFLRGLPRCYQEQRMLLVHGSPKEPTNEYVLPMDVQNPIKMSDLFDRFDHCCLQGHTHIPGVFSQSHFLRPKNIEQGYTFNDDKVMINVGSVGQPRDGDCRACYVVMDDQQLMFRRVEYDIETTVAKIRRIEELDDSFGERLREGC
ncbi:MAG: metallophosphatase family protein [Rubripirellula sp.]|nr:phosphoesterase [Rhodopirellula sp.]MCH1438051.1 metallophosphatase family protein [Rubripirellula sp.]OUX05482.1 MAG: phosphoesterase [Planctomycetaceae bacterium TMED240]